MTRIQFKNGSYEYINSNEDFRILIENEMGVESAKYVQELIDQADYTTRKVNTDLESYEASNESMMFAIQDAINDMESIVNMIEDSKRLNREELIKKLNSVLKNLSNEI